jgi:hypothetical protein
VSDLLLRREIIFGVTYKLRVKYQMGGRIRFLEGRNDRQMTPRGYPNFSFYVKYLRFFVFWMDREINLVWASLTTFLQDTRCAWAGGTLFHCLRKVPPAHSRSTCVVQDLG